jgi:hypothetical protein
VILCQSETATMVVSGCQIQPKAIGDPLALFVQITGNGRDHRITGNSSPGWTNLIPVGCSSEYPNFYQQVGGMADLNAMPVPYTGFGLRNYVQADAEANFPPNSGPHIAVLDTYTANTGWRVQLSFGFNDDGMWHRRQVTGTWGDWSQVVTTYGGMRMTGNLLFNNNTAIQFLDNTGVAAMAFTISPDNTFILVGTDPIGGQRLVATMQQHSNTSPLQFDAPVQFMDKVGFNFHAPIPQPTVTGAKGGNAALTSLIAALAAYGLITDSTS